jgi:hypothetical protein
VTSDYESDVLLGRVLRRFLKSGSYWSSDWLTGFDVGQLTLDGHIADLTEEELIVIRQAGGKDTWEGHLNVLRDGPR